MPAEVLNPRDYRMARLTRGEEPYHFQRNRQLLNKQPRPPQPAIQPNRKPRVIGWGMSSMDYWQGIAVDYLRRKNNGRMA